MKIYSSTRTIIFQSNYGMTRSGITSKNTQRMKQDSSVEVYKMVEKDTMRAGQEIDVTTENKTFIVKRMDFIFEDQECQIINVTDLTAYTKLQKEEDENKLLKMLNASIHHEMLTPVKTMIEISQRLVSKLSKFPQEKRMVETMLISSQFILMHAHDFLD